MKNSIKIKDPAPSSRIGGFTLVEMMMVVGIFLFIFVGVMVAVQIYGLRVYTLEATKLIATQGARTALDHMRDSIREAKNVYVGNCTTANSSSFNMLNGTNLLQGNAIIVYPSTSTNYYTVFYLDTSTGTNSLMEFNVSNSATTYTYQLTSYITNQLVFDAENYQGIVQTNYTALDNREVIRVSLQFSQWEYPIAFVGGNTFNAFNYYQLRTKVFRRAWN